ncbi:tRNA dihydrouridine(16) synthase DusC [Aeromonas cavernicola]|uniref:tRNA-dihydrouridine(16) synthase n=1 Tax=Aeromonas cavernicola TaxID=1006623 RepID=A0A2H9U3N6_9GAMM|nr:tRNA dihydrouridine(16) synthase DusC [Aeromonas cavernicola]PJG58656.1 tRNA dihydrouridine(16) synthase DusC [Aeromonas cavernicola]
MRVVLAPMQGVLDHLMREVLTSINDYDLCISEFIRVVDQLLPEKVFYRLCPELKQGGKTRAGTPVRVQLLGQHPEWLAENALRAIELGSPGVDLNFGCPAPTVNKSKGGAVLLKEPETLYRIVNAVREAVPAHLPVSAKIRLGYEDKALYMENAHAAWQGGADELAVHARTKVEGYKAPAHWQYVDDIRRALPIPVTANGEIWNHADAIACARVSGCETLMVGRGALSLPNLADVMKTGCAHLGWGDVLQLMVRYTEQDLASEKADYYPSRIKQWFSYLRREYPAADLLFRDIRVLKETHPIRDALLHAAQTQI